MVTHGGPIRALLLHCRGLAVSRFGEVERIGNASLTEVVYGVGGALIELVNDAGHLGAGLAQPASAAVPS